jgi:hypothetical protein
MRTPQYLRVLLRKPPRCNRAEMFAVIYLQGASVGLAKAVRLLQNRVEHRRQITRRGVDDLQDFGGRSLLVQCLARLG